MISPEGVELMFEEVVRLRSFLGRVSHPRPTQTYSTFCALPVSAFYR